MEVSLNKKRKKNDFTRLNISIGILFMNNSYAYLKKH